MNYKRIVEDFDKYVNKLLDEWRFPDSPALYDLVNAWKDIRGKIK